MKINDTITQSDYFNALSLLYYKKPLKRDEFECILLNHQNYTCTKCKLPINVELDKLEIDHRSSVYLLSKIALTDILNNIAMKLYNKKFSQVFFSPVKRALNFDKFFFWNKAFLNILFEQKSKNLRVFFHKHLLKFLKIYSCNFFQKNSQYY